MRHPRRESPVPIGSPKGIMLHGVEFRTTPEQFIVSFGVGEREFSFMDVVLARNFMNTWISKKRKQVYDQERKDHARKED